MPAAITTFTIGSGANAIPFKIRTNAPFSYANGETGPNRTVTYQVKGGWGPRACDALYGVGLYVLTTTGGTTYPNPHRFPGNTALTCHAVRGEPKSGWAPDYQLVAGHEFDEIIADYAVNHFDTDGTEHDTVSRTGMEVPWSSISTRAEEGEIAIRKNAVLAGGNRIPSDAKTFTIPDPVLEYIFQRGMIQDYVAFEDVLNPIKGRTNDAVFFGYPAGTLLMGPWDTRVMMDATGKRNQEFTMSIKYREHGWNSIPDPDDPASWVPVTTVASGGDVIPSVSFDPIIHYGVL